MRVSRQEAKRRAEKCDEPLSLEPGAIQAFADRQAKLVVNEKWPIVCWYNDEDFCRAYNTAVMQGDEVKRLREMLDERTLQHKIQLDNAVRLHKTVEAYEAEIQRLWEIRKAAI